MELTPTQSSSGPPHSESEPEPERPRRLRHDGGDGFARLLRAEWTKFRRYRAGRRVPWWPPCSWCCSPSHGGRQPHQPCRRVGRRGLRRRSSSTTVRHTRPPRSAPTRHRSGRTAKWSATVSSSCTRRCPATVPSPPGSPRCRRPLCPPRAGRPGAPLSTKAFVVPGQGGLIVKQNTTQAPPTRL